MKNSKSGESISTQMAEGFEGDRDGKVNMGNHVTPRRAPKMAGAAPALNIFPPLVLKARHPQRHGKART